MRRDGVARHGVVEIGFNSRTREGATVWVGGTDDNGDSFNSRTREGATWRAPADRRRGKCFNSRTREGATHRVPGGQDTIRVSIHAPVRVRQYKYHQNREHGQFQFTHP